MNRKISLFCSIPIIALLTFLTLAMTMDFALGEGATNFPWPSFRRDLLNTAQAPDSGYPTTPTILWSEYRTDRPDIPGTPAAAGGPLVVDKGMVFTTGKGIVQANDQFDGSFKWSSAFTTEITTEEPADAPTDWCYNDTVEVSSNTGKCYVENMADCPSWCFECTTEKPDCTKISLINPLTFPEGYAQFITGPTLDTSYGDNGAIIFGTFDGRVISLDMSDGTTIWERTPFKDPPLGPSVGRPWYDKKFAWHLSPPSIANGKVYIGTFIPSFYYIFRYNAYGTPKLGFDYQHYWVGRDGWFYALDESDGSILWTWDPDG
jgi:outer membrane protein assembly factor BamB